MLWNGYLPFSWFGCVLLSHVFLIGIVGGRTHPQKYSQTDAVHYGSLTDTVFKSKLPPTFIFNPNVPHTVSQLAVLGVTDTGLLVPGIPPEVIRDSEVIFANSQVVIGLGLQAMLTSSHLKAQAPLSGTTQPISEALNAFLLLGMANALTPLARQNVRLARLSAVLGSIPDVPSPVRVPVPSFTALGLSNAATILATAPSLLNALTAVVTLAEVNEAAGGISLAERDVIRSNSENLATLVRLIAVNALVTINIQAERDAAANVQTQVKINTPGNGKGGLVKISDSDVLNNLGSDILTNVQVLSNDATITNTGTTDGGLDLLGGILKPLLGGIEGRVAKTGHLVEAPVTGSDPTKRDRSLSRSEIRQLIELNNQLEFLTNHLQQVKSNNAAFS